MFIKKKKNKKKFKKKKISNKNFVTFIVNVFCVFCFIICIHIVKGQLLIQVKFFVSDFIN